MKTRTGLTLLLFLASSLAADMNDAELTALVEQRIDGDRSAACVAVARVGSTVARARVCADPDRARELEASARFEIGSVSKAFVGVLAARLVAQGLIDLDEPLADLLPEHVVVPALDDQPIRLRHLLAHTSGLPRLPANMPKGDPHNPYANLTPELLLESIGSLELEVPPGQRWEYSNFGAMLLSLALSQRAGVDLDELFERELFGPLSMTSIAIGGEVIAGHDIGGNPVRPWDFTTNLAGVGGLRATLDDMVIWLQAALGEGPETVVAALRQSFTEISAEGGVSMAWGWIRIPVNDRIVLVHDGGTAGFSSFMAIDPERGVASVVLSDTSLIDQGSLGDLAMHLIDPQLPLSKPRQPIAVAEGVDLADYTGSYPLFDGDTQFMGDFVLEVFAKDGGLHVQGVGGGMEQPSFAVDPDGADRFVHPGLGLELNFVRDGEGQVTLLDFHQGGMKLEGRRHQALDSRQ